MFRIYYKSSILVRVLTLELFQTILENARAIELFFSIIRQLYNQLNSKGIEIS